MNEILNVFRDGQPALREADLDRFRPISATLKGRRKAQLRIIESVLYKILGWYSRERLQTELDTLSFYHEELVPLNITKTWRLGAGENDRLARRLDKVLEVATKNTWACSYYVNASLENTPEKLNKKLTKYKTINSRDNYNVSTDIEHYSEFLRLDADDFWDFAIEGVNNSSNGRNSWIDSSIKRLFYVKAGSETLKSSHITDENGVESSMFYGMKVITNPRNFAANLIVVLKQALARVRECPDVEESQEYPELTQYIEEELLHINSANQAFENSTIVDSIILKNESGLYSIVKIEFKDLALRILHPSKKHKEVVVRPFVDLYNKPYCMEYYIVKKIGSKNRVLKPYAFTTVANSSTNHPFPYNTALADSSTALSMRSFFNDQTNNRQLIPKDNCCFSDYQSCITTNSLSRGYLSLINNVRSWTTGYIPGRTTPYRHPKDIFFGLPKDMPDWYNGLHDCSPRSCANLFLSIDIQSEDKHRTTVADLSKKEIMSDAYLLRKLDYISDFDLQILRNNKCNNCKLKGACSLEEYVLGALNLPLVESETIEATQVESEGEWDESLDRLKIPESSSCVHDVVLSECCDECLVWAEDNGVSDYDECFSSESEEDDQTLAAQEHQESRRREIMAEMTNWAGTV